MNPSSGALVLLVISMKLHQGKGAAGTPFHVARIKDKPLLPKE